LGRFTGQLQKSAQKYAFFSAKSTPYCVGAMAMVAYYNLYTMAIKNHCYETLFEYCILKILIDILGAIISFFKP
jgi:hypothetical protein